MKIADSDDLAADSTAATVKAHHSHSAGPSATPLPSSSSQEPISKPETRVHSVPEIYGPSLTLFDYIAASHFSVVCPGEILLSQVTRPRLSSWIDFCVAFPIITTLCEEIFSEKSHENR